MPSKELLAVFAKYADPATQRLSYRGMVRLLDEHYAVDVAATFTAAAGTAAGAGSGGPSHTRSPGTAICNLCRSTLD